MSSNTIAYYMCLHPIRDMLIAACNRFGINVPTHSDVFDLGPIQTESGDYVGGWQIGDYVIAGIDWGTDIQIANIYCPDGTIV